MLNIPRVVIPGLVRQAPDNRALNHTTTLVVGTQQLSTEPQAQQYFEPGVNVKLKHRRRPKTNYELPSDMPKYPLGFVPTNQTPGANGEEPAEIRVKEAVPADLLSMFAKISAQQAIESKAVEEAKIVGSTDVGTLIAQQMTATLKERNLEAKTAQLIREGYTEGEVAGAIATVRQEDVVAKARLPAKPAPVETVLAEVMPRRSALEQARADLTEDEKAEIKRLEREGAQRMSRIQRGLPPFLLAEEVLERQGVKDVASAIRQAMARKSKEESSGK